MFLNLYVFSMWMGFEHKVPAVESESFPTLNSLLHSHKRSSLPRTYFTLFQTPVKESRKNNCVTRLLE